MSKIINNKIEHFNLSFFPNSITGSYDPKIESSNSPSPASGEEGTTSSGRSARATTSRATTTSSDGTTSSSAPEVTPKITGDFTLRMSKLPADNFSNIIPIMSVDPSTNKTTPSVFYESMDETGTYNKNTFLKGLNDALSECIKLGDTCYAVVIKDPTDPSVPTSSFGLAHKFELAQKPPQNQTNDSEFLLCNSQYITYLKNKTTTGFSNLMPNSIVCEFNSDPVQYEGSFGNNSIKPNSNITPESPKKEFSYMKMGRVQPKSKPFPWGITIGIALCILFIGSGIYYYYNFGPGAPTIPVKKIVKKVVKGGLLTSKFIRKSGGYFFFI
jgi:hypothetical protein